MTRRDVPSGIEQEASSRDSAMLLDENGAMGCDGEKTQIRKDATQERFETQLRSHRIRYSNKSGSGSQRPWCEDNVSIDKEFSRSGSRDIHSVRKQTCERRLLLMKLEKLGRGPWVVGGANRFGIQRKLILKAVDLCGAGHAGSIKLRKHKEVFWWGDVKRKQVRR